MAADAGDPGPSDEELPPDPFPGDPFADASPGGPSNPSAADPLAGLLGAMGAMGGGVGGPGGLGGGLGPLLAALGGGGGGLAWDSARQIALWTAASGAVEPNVEPMERIKLEELVRNVRPIVIDTTGLELPTCSVEAVTHAGWAAIALEDARSLFEQAARAAGTTDPSDAPGSETDAIAQILRLVGPMMVSSAVGALVGQLGAAALGTYDVLVPRTGDRLTFVPAGIAAFAAEWSIPVERATTHVVLVDLITHAVLRAPHVAARLRSLLDRYANATRVDADRLTDRIETMMSEGGTPDPRALSFNEPSAEQLIVRAQIDDLLVPIVGFIDYAAMVAGARVLGDNRQIVEAWRRRRSGDAEGAARLAAQVADLLGVSPAASLAERGAAFIGGVMQRAGSEGLRALWSSEQHLPTRAELDAPGLWLARIELG